MRQPSSPAALRFLAIFLVVVATTLAIGALVRSGVFDPAPPLTAAEQTLLTASRRGDLDAVKQTIAGGVNVNVQEAASGDTALMRAAGFQSPRRPANAPGRRRQAGCAPSERHHGAVRSGERRARGRRTDAGRGKGADRGARRRPARDAAGAGHQSRICRRRTGAARWRREPHIDRPRGRHRDGTRQREGRGNGKGRSTRSMRRSSACTRR